MSDEDNVMELALKVLRKHAQSSAPTGAGWYMEVTEGAWPAIKAKLLAENQKYTWPGGSPLSAFGPEGEYIFCKGDDIVWQADNLPYLKSTYSKRTI